MPKKRDWIEDEIHRVMTTKPQTAEQIYSAIDRDCFPDEMQEQARVAEVLRRLKSKARCGNCISAIDKESETFRYESIDWSRVPSWIQPPAKKS